DEYLDDSRTLESRSRGAEPDTIAALIEELRETEMSLPGYAAKDGEVLSAIGSAYAALGAFPLAIDAYERSLNDPGSKVLVRAVEQLANLQYRYAAQISGDDRGELVRKAARPLQW